MIEDLRFIEIEEKQPDGPVSGLLGKKRILQAYDGHVWYDVPLVMETAND